MSTGSYLESHIGISPDPFLELSAEARGRKVRERMGDLHAFLDDGKPIEERDLPPLTRERSLELRQAIRDAIGGDDSAARALDARFLTDSFVRSEYTKDQNVYLEFEGGEFDAGHNRVENVHSKLKFERDSRHQGMMKAVGSSSLFPNEVVCTFVALTS